MRDNKYMQCILCEGVDLADSVRIFNKEMKRLRELNPTFERYDNNFLIYVRCNQMQPENIAEAKEMQGINHKCIECEHCIRQMNSHGVPDRRIKKAICRKDGSRISINTNVCDIFYIEHQDEETKFKKTRARKEA